MPTGIQEKIADALNDLNKQFGNYSVMRMSDAPKEFFTVQIRPTGVLQLDYALGVGGIPRGRTIEIYGPESSGKSTLSQIMAAAAQSVDPECIVGVIDPEQTFDADYAEALGMEPNRTILAQPTSGEEAIDISRRLLLSGVDFLIIDSVTALVPTAEVESDMDENFVGLHARLMSKALRVLTPAMNMNKAKRGNVIFINQIREKVGSYGNPETTTGGRALRFFASVRMCVRSGAKDDKLIRKVEDPFSGKMVDEEYGQRCRISITKNKVGKPHTECSYDLIYGIGPDRVREALDMGVVTGLIKKGGGGNYTYVTEAGEEIKIRGEATFLEFLRTTSEVYEELRRRLSSRINREQIYGIPAEEELKLSEEEEYQLAL